MIESSKIKEYTTGLRQMRREREREVKQKSLESIGGDYGC